MANDQKDPVASASDAVLKHLADPQNNPLPEGTRINFGDPEPFGKLAKDDPLASPAKPAANADFHS